MENDKVDDTLVTLVTEISEVGELTEPAIEEELLVEEISIDGMCGVY